MSGWREVCRWDVEPSMAPLEYGEQVSLAESLMEAGKIGLRYHQAFENMAAAFEELAGEHRELWEAFMRDAEALSTPCPGDPEDYTFVRAYYRPRRSKLAAIDPDQGTVQAAPGEGQTGASGEATGHSPEGADPQIRDAYCRGRSGIPLGNWCNESQSGDATGADKEQPCPGCGSYRGTHGLGCRLLALTQSGEERSE